MVGRISDTVKDDHRTIEACYVRIINTSERDEQIRFQNLFTWELARNLVGKELVVYPALEKHVNNGGSLANKSRSENHYVRKKNPARDLLCGCANTMAKDQGRIEKIPEPGPFEFRIHSDHQQFDGPLKTAYPGRGNGSAPPVGGGSIGEGERPPLQVIQLDQNLPSHTSTSRRTE